MTEHDFGDDVDVRQVPVDQLARLPKESLQIRRERVESLLETYGKHVETAEAVLKRVRELYAFLREQHENVDLAQRLQVGDVVRVKCVACQGTGMKPTDVLSGRVLQNQGSAFEKVRANQVQKIDPALQCEECEGKQWVLMERFRG